MIPLGVLQQQVGGTAPSTLLNNLVGWWTLSEPSGTRADSHGTNDMTEVGTISSATGKIGNCADFDPNEHFYALQPVNGGDNDWTVCFWFNPDLITSPAVLCCSGVYNSGSITGYNFSIGFGGTNQLEASMGVAGSWQTVTATPTLTAGNWYFCRCYYDSATNTFGIQIDDNAVDEITITGTPQDVANVLVIGAQRSGFGGYNGKLDEVAAWNRLLTTGESGEVAQLYNAGAGITYANLEQPDTLFLAEFNGEFAAPNAINYVPDIGSTGTGSQFGTSFTISGGYVEIASTSGNEQGLIWPHDDFGANYDIEYRLCVFINSVQGGQYLQFDSNNPNADNAIIFGLGDGAARLWLTGGGSGGIANSYAFTDNNATWYTIKVEVRGQNLELFVDDEQGGGYVSQGSTTVTGRTLGGVNNRKIGPRTWYTSGGYSGMPIFDWIRVTAV